MDIDYYNDAIDYFDWVVEPPSDILQAMSGTLDADADLREDRD
jgi:hypothetical protein